MTSFADDDDLSRLARAASMAQRPLGIAIETRRVESIDPRSSDRSNSEKACFSRERSGNDHHRHRRRLYNRISAKDDSGHRLVDPSDLPVNHSMYPLRIVLNYCKLTCPRRKSHRGKRGILEAAGTQKNPRRP